MPILIDHFELLNLAMQRKLLDRSANVIAWVVLPNHFHMLINPADKNLSVLMKSFKLSFSESLRKSNDEFRGRIWQLRFWDHIIRDERDLNMHVNYIHYNPVKHGLTDDPFEWKYSSLNEFYKKGLYQRDWGVNKKIDFGGEYGE
jgi:putative transposase